MNPPSAAAVKTALKNDPASPAMQALADRWPVEAAAAILECADGLDVAAPDSWVATQMAGVTSVHPNQESLL